MATITGRLNRSWFGKIPVGFRWLLAIGIVIAIVAVAISFAGASGSDATAQTPVAVAPAVAQQPGVPAAAASPQTVQLTTAQQKSLEGTLWHIIFAIERRPENPASPQAAAQMDQFQRDFNYPHRIRELWIDGSVTQATNGTAKAHLKIQAWDRSFGTNAWNKLVAERKATVEFVLDQNRRITQVTNFQYR